MEGGEEDRGGEEVEGKGVKIRDSEVGMNSGKVKKASTLPVFGFMLWSLNLL